MIENDPRASLPAEELSRRGFFALLGGAGLLALVAGCNRTGKERQDERAEVVAKLPTALRTMVAEPRRFQSPADALSPTLFPIEQRDGAFTGIQRARFEAFGSYSMTW